jgi:hypothetical protein
MRPRPRTQFLVPPTAFIEGSAAYNLRTLIMPPVHRSLFDDDPANTPADAALVAHSRRARPLDKKEQAVNRLLAKVQSLRSRLDGERRRLDQALVFHAAHVGPRVQRVTALRKEVVRALRPFIVDPRLKEGDRRVLRTIVAGQVDDILAHDASPDKDIQELFERLHGVGIAQVAQEQIDQARSKMAAMFSELGLDIEVPELRPNMSEEEIAATAAQMADRMREIEDARVESRPARRKTKREMREEERVRRFDQLRKVSIGAIYRRLAKALHPDLERDADLRERKGALMQEVTSAYTRNDVHTLLRLELEWLDGQRTDAARPTDETLDAYTELLKQQVAELEAECLELPFHPRYQPLLSAVGPFGNPILIDGPAEVHRLDLVSEGLRGALERMAAGKAWHEVRGLIQAHRKANRTRRRY